MNIERDGYRLEIMFYIDLKNKKEARVIMGFLHNALLFIWIVI